MEHGKFQDSWFQYQDLMKNSSDQKCTSSSSIGEDSDASNGSSISSLDTSDDASSSASANSSSSVALYDLSEIMEQLPIKRGLSKFYKGKSESFTSLSRVASIEDLAKKTSPYRRNLKASKSCGTGLHSYKQYSLHPKATISKKAVRGSTLSSFPSKRVSFLSDKPPLIPLHQNSDC